MRSVLFRLDITQLHVGGDSLELARNTVPADTLFSAMCHAALGRGGVELLDRFVQLSIANELRVTDAFPYVHDARDTSYFLPKPFVKVSKSSHLSESASVDKKLAKKIDLVPHSQIGQFAKGDGRLGDIVAKQVSVGRYGVAERATIFNGKDDAEPYRVGYFRFAPNAGLWLVVAGSEESVELSRLLLEDLASTGIGGERSTGYGQFTLSQADIPPALSKITHDAHEGNMYLQLSVGLPDDSELEPVMIGARYRLIRRSGFVASGTFASRPLRKRDIYKLAAGAVVDRTYEGQIADVGVNGAHPVYSYGKPLFLPLEDVER